MGIKFDENKKYWIVSCSMRHPTTRKPRSLIRRGIKTRAEARRVEKELIVDLHEKLKETLVPKWKTLLDFYIDSLHERQLSLKTIDNYKLSLRAYTLNRWGDRTIDKVSSGEIRELMDELIKRKSPSHCKNILKQIRGAFNFAIEKGYIARNPSPKMKFKISSKLLQVLTIEQIKILLNQAKLIECEWYPIWATALYTGMRNGELYALTWDKVNLEGRKILVDCSWNNKVGFKSTKSGDDRIVEIAPELLYILKELKLKECHSNFVLPRIDKWDKGEQARELRMFLMGLGLPRIRFHDLRASWATAMLSKGIAPIKVMSMGGWKDLKTMQFYIRKAGVNILGITDSLRLHDPVIHNKNVISLG